VLTSAEATKGNLLMLRVIRDLKGSNAVVASNKFFVSAKVNGEQIITQERFECQFTKELESVCISVYWEEGGYKLYKKLGLFGSMDTKWQKVRRRGDVIYISNPEKSYEIRIQLKDDGS
jgi:hypothetical protein